MDSLIQKLTNKHLLCKESVLNQVDPYTLYCYYYGQELTINQPVLSTVRGDDTRPSFCIYYRSNDLLYYDYGMGTGGDVFRFIGARYNLSLPETLKKINTDFQLGFEGEHKGVPPVIYNTPEVKPKQILRITSTSTFSKQALDYWAMYHIPKEILDLYNVREVQYIHADNNWFRPPTLCFAYYIGEYFKLYYPFNEKGNKFYNNFPRTYVEGYLQLPKTGRLLVITKSTKDVMLFRVLGISSVSPKGEKVKIPDFILADLETRFSKVITFFDPDSAGIGGSQLYQYPARFLNNGVKDITDYAKTYGLINSRNLVAKLIHSI